MDLTAEQKSAVSAWVAGGASIAEVQRRLREEHQVSLTFMDTRFLIDDLNLVLKSREPPRKPDAPREDPTGGDPRGTAPPPDEDVIDAEPVGTETPGGGTVRVEVDRLTRPGTVVSGTVTFSDGKTGNWALDQVGRLVFEAAEQGYRPSEADLQQFQQELSLKLQKQGF